MSVYRGQVAVTPSGQADGSPVAASVEPGDASLSIVPEGLDPVELAYTDIDDLFDDDYTMRLTDYTGRRYALTMFGKAYGQILADVAKRRRDRLQHDLLLTGVGTPKSYPGFVFGGPNGPVPAELRLFDDLLVVMPERGLMWGLPYSFVDRVDWDDDLYQVRVTDDLGDAHVFGRLAKRSHEFLDDLRAKLDALARRTAQTLATLLPGIEPGSLSRLAGLMRDGRAVQQRAVDAIDPALWTRLEGVVVGTPGLQATYDALNAMTPPGWAAFGVKAVLTEEKDDLPDVRFTDAGDREATTSRESRTAFRQQADAMRNMPVGIPLGGRGPFGPGGYGAVPSVPGGLPARVDPTTIQRLVEQGVREALAGQHATPEAASAAATAPTEGQREAGADDAGEERPAEQPTRLWYFCPLHKDGRPINVVAQEVTSEGGHATYLFRMMEPRRFSSLSGDGLADAVAASIARLNRALLTLNFRREPIYLPEDHIDAGRYARYKVALRKLDYLRWTREGFLGRAIHKDETTWRAQLEDAIARA